MSIMYKLYDILHKIINVFINLIVCNYYYDFSAITQFVSLYVCV